MKPLTQVSPPIQSGTPRRKWLPVARPVWFSAPFAIIAIIAAFLSKSHFTWPDEVQYYKLAYNLVHFHIYSLDGVSPTAYRTPGYPFFLAILFGISSNIAFLHFANFSLWLGSAYLTYRISQMLYGNLAGAISLVWILLYPLSLYTSIFLYPQMLASALFLSSLYVHLKLSPSRVGWFLVEGLLFGILILTVPIYLFALPCLIIFVVAQSEKPWRALVILILGLALPLGAWTTRNYSTYHAFVLSTEGGSILLNGNSPNTTVSAGPDVDIRTYRDQARRLKLDELQTDVFYRRSAVDWMLHHPGKCLVLYGEKLANWFNFRNVLVMSAQGSAIKWVVLFITWYSLLAVAILRIWLTADNLTGVEFYLWAIYATGALSYALFFTRVRYRVPFDYILIIQAAACVAEFLRKRGLFAAARGSEEYHLSAAGGR
jgi:hypothetical protein